MKSFLGRCTKLFGHFNSLGEQKRALLFAPPAGKGSSECKEKVKGAVPTKEC